MCCDTAGCVKSSAAAASENEPRTATSRNVVSSLRSSITDHYVIASNSSLDMIDSAARTMLSMNNLTIRSATAADAAALDRLAAARQRRRPRCSAARRRARTAA